MADISKLTIQGITYDVKDAVARQAINNGSVHLEEVALGAEDTDLYKKYALVNLLGEEVEDLTGTVQYIKIPKDKVVSTGTLLTVPATAPDEIEDPDNYAIYTEVVGALGAGAAGQTVLKLVIANSDPIYINVRELVESQTATYTEADENLTFSGFDFTQTLVARFNITWELYNEGTKIGEVVKTYKESDPITYPLWEEFTFTAADPSIYDPETLAFTSLISAIPHAEGTQTATVQIA